MNLDEAQRKKVAEWVSQGLRLSEIQRRLGSELGINMTYMELRFLVDDLKLTPRDLEPPKTAQLSPAVPPSAPGGLASTPPPKGPAAIPEEPPRRPGGVSVSVDSIARPGAVVSGKVTFSDGNSAEWYLDDLGRLGLMPRQQGYRPSPQDVQTFQAELQNELARMGF